MELIKLIQSQEPALRELIVSTDERWKALTGKLELQKELAKSDYYDEVVWTFLLCLSYASAGEKGVRSLIGKLTEKRAEEVSFSHLWLEALPLPPRLNEGNTNLDLACGSITKRDGKTGGIQFDPSGDGSILFCEMKWYSDISKGVTYDQQRNQLARVIENAVTFQANGEFPKRVDVTLVTPKFLVEPAVNSRLYHYKMEDYRENPLSLLEEWEHSDRYMKRRDQAGWVYPPQVEIRERLTSCLNLHHLAFEDLFSSAPETELANAIREFEKTCNRFSPSLQAPGS